MGKATNSTKFNVNAKSMDSLCIN